MMGADPKREIVCPIGAPLAPDVCAAGVECRGVSERVRGPSGFYKTGGSGSRHLVRAVA